MFKYKLISKPNSNNYIMIGIKINIVDKLLYSGTSNSIVIDMDRLKSYII